MTRTPSDKPDSEKAPPPFLKKEKSEPPPPLPESSVEWLESSKSLPAPPPSDDWLDSDMFTVTATSPTHSSSSEPSSPGFTQAQSGNFGPRLRAELALLKASIDRAFVLNDQRKFTYGSLKQVEEAEVRLRSWKYSRNQTEWGSVIHYHFKALRTMLKAFKSYCFQLENDYFVVYSLFRKFTPFSPSLSLSFPLLISFPFLPESSIIAFWYAMQNFQRHRPKRKQLNPRDLPLMDSTDSLQHCRNDLVHKNAFPVELKTLVKQTIDAFTWYTRNFWPNLSFEHEENDDGTRICKCAFPVSYL